MEYIAIVVLLSLIEYIFFMAMVGKARTEYSISAPAIIGNEMFERVFRVQQNTLEQLVIFIPAIYLCGYYLHAVAAAMIGFFFIIGRAIYYKGYTADPAKRGAGMLISFFTNVILILGGLTGIVKSLF